MIKKIILGTANFGSNYGVINKNFIDFSLAKEILSVASKNGIYHLDTAPDYKNSEIILGNIGVKNFNIATKLLPPTENNYDFKKFFYNNINVSLKRLNIENLSILYFRRPTSLLEGDNNKLWNYAKNLKKEGLINSIGITLYNTQELDIVFDVLRPDVVQVPYNLFDQRLDKTNWLDKLYENNVIIQCRSVFLQGLLFCSINNIPQRFIKFKFLWEKYHNWLKTNNLSMLEANINFITQNKKISHYIVGVENINQLLEIINVKEKKIKHTDTLSTINKDIIDPRLWNKN